MYLAYWGLRSQPFASQDVATPFFVGGVYGSVLRKLEYAIERRDAVTCLLGFHGAGKTRLLVEWQQRLGDRANICWMTYPALDAESWLAYLAEKLAPGDKLGRTTGDRALLAIEQALQHSTRGGRPTIIVVDDAHSISSPAVWAVLEGLCRLHHRGRSELLLALAGTPELAGILHRHPALQQRATLRGVLVPLDVAGVTAYVSSRLQASGRDELVFTTAALQRLTLLAGGLPRRIDQLCDLSMLIAFADQTATVSVEQVNAVAEELTLGRAA